MTKLWMMNYVKGSVPPHLLKLPKSKEEEAPEEEEEEESEEEKEEEAAAGLGALFG